MSRERLAANPRSPKLFADGFASTGARIDICCKIFNKKRVWLREEGKGAKMPQHQLARAEDAAKNEITRP